MTQRRCLLHIGLCKTGTTSVQHVLAANRPLLESHGYFVPCSLGPTPNHRRLVLLALDQASDSGAWEWEAMRNRDPGLRSCRDLVDGQRLIEHDLFEELEHCPAHALVVFSSEQLSQRLLCDADIQRLRDVLRRLGFVEIQVLVYLREQVGLALSWQAMEILAGKVPTLELGFGESFDHRLLLERWERVFGREAIQARTYARQCLHRGDVVNDMLRVGLSLPAELPLADLQQWRNRRLGARRLRLLRGVNQWLPELVPPGPNPRRLQLLRWLGHPLWGRGRPQQPSQALIEECYARYRISNQWVDQHYGTRLSDTFART